MQFLAWHYTPSSHTKSILQNPPKQTEESHRESPKTEQVGFRSGKSCTDQVFTLRQILEQCTEWNSSIYINIVDFEKAFDSLHQSPSEKSSDTMGFHWEK